MFGAFAASYLNSVVPAAVSTIMGLQTANGTTPGSSNRCWASRFQAPVSGNITSMSIVVASSPSGQTKFLIFDDNASNLPGNLLASSAAFSTTSAGTKNAAISLAVTAGTWYWLASVGNSALFCDYGGSQGLSTTTYKMSRKESYTFATPPSTFGTPTETDTGQCQQIWATIQ